jgi:siroheme synthase
MGGGIGKVKLVGVGPGHPGLATVQAVEAIKEADVIRHVDGCGVALLHLARANADIASLESTEEVVRLARTGRNVTVLFQAIRTPSRTEARWPSVSSVRASTSRPCPA